MRRWDPFADDGGAPAWRYRHQRVSSVRWFLAFVALGRATKVARVLPLFFVLWGFLGWSPGCAFAIYCSAERDAAHADGAAAYVHDRDGAMRHGPPIRHHGDVRGRARRGGSQGTAGTEHEYPLRCETRGRT